jgi:AraC-like DNA-binding protein
MTKGIRRNRLDKTSSSRRDLLEAVDAYVRSCFRRESPPRVSELARTLGLSRRTLMKRFREVQEVTPSAYVKKMQIARAKILLLRGWPTERCAQVAGFGTPRSLFRSFRELVVR